MQRREPRTNVITRHRLRGRAAARGHVIVAVLGCVGLAAGVSAFVGLPVAAQPDEPPKQPETTPPDTERDRLMKMLQEEAAKHGAEVKSQAPAKPAATPPQPAGPKVTDIPRKDPAAVPAPKPGAGHPSKPPAKEPERTPPKTSGGQNKPVTPNPTIKPPTTPPGPAAVPGVTNVPAMPMAPGAAGADGQTLPPVESAFTDDGKSFVFNFTDATELALIVQYVQQALNLQIIANDSGLLGQKVVLMTPVTVPTSQILPFLTYLLEQKGYTMIRDTRGIYIITQVNQITPQIGNDSSNSTQVIHTPGLKPSSIQAIITSLLNANRAAPGGGAPATQPIFNDDLGVIIITDTPNNIELVKTIVKELIDQQSKIAYTRFPVNHIAASSARDRILELVGSSTGGVGVGRAPGSPAPNAAPVAAPVGGSISNLAERLSLDSSTNALMFKGRTDETAQLFRLLQLVDVPSQFTTEIYKIGNRATEVLVDAARQQQLGEVTYFSSEDAQGLGGGGVSALGARGRGGVQPGIGGQQSSAPIGAGFVVYPEAGMFVYRGTPQQHGRIKEMIRELGPLSEFDDTITYEFIKLKHSKATELAQTVTDVLNSTSSSGNRGALLGRNLGDRTRNRDTATSRTRDIERAAAGERTNPSQPSAPGEVTEINSEDVHVLADEPTNQVVVRAPKRLQPQLKALINKLDLRRPQVFIEAKIVAINTSEDFRLAVEVQQVIGQFALNTNFGLGSVGTSTSGASLLDPKNVFTNLSGLTTAVIRSKDVPIIINAIQTNTDSRILASPQVLVDDNQEATVESLDQQPTLTTTIGTTNQNNTQSFGGFEPAGPRLTVKPQISEGGYMKLEFEIELSSFTGSSSVAGVPPPKLENRVKTDSVTVPSDTTIVVGGLQLEQLNTTVNGIPLLKDIPLIGQLFRDTRNTTRNITLYVFITPKIMRDPSFADLRLLTRKPLSTSRLEQELPPTEHERIDVLQSAQDQTSEEQEATIDDQRPQFDIIRPESGSRKKTSKKTGTMYEGN